VPLLRPAAGVESGNCGTATNRARATRCTTSWAIRSPREIWTAVARFDELPDVMNVGTGEDHTVTEYYEAAASAVGWSGRFVYDRSRPVGMRRKLLNVGRQTAFGWAPARSLQAGLRATYDHLASRPAAEVEALMDAWAEQ